MKWLPVPRDVRADLRTALIEADLAMRAARLRAIAQHRLSFVETIQLDRALGTLGGGTVPGLVGVRLALLASSTVDHLVAPIRVAGLRRGLLIEVHLGAFGQHRQALLDSSSALYRAQPQAVLFALDAREPLNGVTILSSASDVGAALEAWIAELRTLWGQARTSFNATVLQQTILNTAEPVFGSFDRCVAGTPASAITHLNDRIAAAAATEGVLLVDAARASERDGLDAWFDLGRWLQGKLAIAPQAAASYGELVARVLAAERGLSKKCLVLDLDNTLWGGVVGDDGVAGLVLGEGTPVGEAHLALQRYAKQLSERGIILAVCSKNDPAIAEAAFRQHPEMVLSREDIAAFVANWDDKTVNLQRIASQLNIGLDSLVFVDDNPVERARVRESLPMVGVPELPDDVALYARCVADAGYFEAVTFTTDDRDRRIQYARNAARETFQASAQSLGAFLEGLSMEMVYGPVELVDRARVTQLIGKTNQFNLTTRRHSAQEVARFCDDPAALTLQVRLFDRFGDNGLVSAVILAPDPKHADTLEIDTWIMSCRVFGRELECEVMNVLVELARARGVRAIWGDYIPTPKNGVVSDLYGRLGFAPAVTDAAAAGTTRWTLEIDAYRPCSTHIRRRTAHDARGNPAVVHDDSSRRVGG